MGEVSEWLVTGDIILCKEGCIVQHLGDLIYI